MHQEALAYVRRAAADLAFSLVVEIGSRDINGTPRPAFSHGEYIGIDLHDGPGVDVVADAATVTLERPADVVVCCEVLEHAARPAELVAAAARLLKKGGRLIVTCATDPRAPHSAIDGGALRDGEHYRNVDPDDLGEWLEDAGFRASGIEVHHDRGDLYATATK